MNRAKELYKELYNRIEMEDGLACREVPDAFFIEEMDPNRKYKVALSKKLCGECPVKLLCLEYALEAREEHGVWGGTLPKERYQMIRDRRLVA